MNKPLLDVRNVTIAYPRWGGILRHKIGEVKAVEDVSFTIQEGETLGLVGESGCGKTTLAKAIVNILKPTVPGIRQSGEINFTTAAGPVNLLATSQSTMRPLRADIQIIFQDPFSSLNPRHTVGTIIDAPLRIHAKQTARERQKWVEWLLDRVGLQAEHAGRYPHEFSGRKRQRIGIARALAVNPRLIVADEPVSALDVSVQAQVINLMQDLQEEFKLTYLFVAHDLSVVHHISTRIAVMYLGHIVEIGTSDQVYDTPVHPYSRALLSAVPHPDPRRSRPQRTILEGDPPTPLAKPSGCPFRTRCPLARPTCADAMPPLEPKPPGQMAACPFSDDPLPSEISAPK